jgi:hypothetical protein
VAHERNTLATLKRRKGETLAQLLTRLDLAIAGAQTETTFSLTRLDPNKFSTPVFPSGVPDHE